MVLFDSVAGSRDELELVQSRDGHSVMLCGRSIEIELTSGVVERAA